MIHFIYPYGINRYAAPWTIGNEIGKRLVSDGYDIRQYDWLDNRVIHPNPGDILIGHPNKIPGHIFTNSLYGCWGKRIIMCPWMIDIEDIIVNDWLINSCDVFLCITGEHWFNFMPYSWRKKSIRLDMAIDWDFWPDIKNKKYSPGGKRNILYIGHTLGMKNLEYLLDIFNGLKYEYPKIKLGHIGHGEIPQAENYEYTENLLDYKKVLKKYDFIISTSSKDANCTTLLEGVAMGFLSFATPQSGWLDRDTNFIPLDDTPLSIKIISRWQEASNEAIVKRVAQNYNECKRYTFQQMYGQVLKVLKQ